MEKRLEAWNINRDEFDNLSNQAERTRFLLKYAVLAPSTHNSQPWLFRVSDTSCHLYIDQKISVKEADPTSRHLHLSLGCCLENMVIAAKYFGMYEDVVYGNGKIGEAVAGVELKEPDGLMDESEGNLLDAVIKRRNSRGFFLADKVGTEVLSKISPVPSDDIEVTIVDDPELIKRMAMLTAEGVAEIYKGKAFRWELASWIRTIASRKLDGMPTDALKIPSRLSLFFPTILRLKDLSPKLSKLNYASFASAPLVCVIGSENHTPDNWIRMGRHIERLMLEFNMHDIQTSIFVAGTEKEARSRQIKEIIGSKYIPQFIFCAGFINIPSGHTPRHPVESKLC